MSLKKEIFNEVNTILENKFEVEQVDYVPDIENTKLTFGNKGLQFKGTVLYIDMRGSTAILSKHNRPIVAKILSRLRLAQYSLGLRRTSLWVTVH